MELFVFALMFWIVPVLIAWYIAQKKNRNYVLWAFLTLFISWLTVPLLLILSKRDKPVKFF